LAAPGSLSSLAKSGGLPEQLSTVPINQQALSNLADHVRTNYDLYRFSDDWWNRAAAWRATDWVAAAVYSYPSWGDCSGYGGYGSEPAYYDYGSNVVYQGENVYVNGDAVATQEEYAEQAKNIAETGQQAQAATEDEWLPLGVFAMVQGNQSSSNDLFQLAMNKAGILRGNYYNALSDTTLPIHGSADRKTQRAAWTVGDRKEPIFEAGLANLTKSETTMLVHFGNGRTQQCSLVRIEQSTGPK